MIDQATIDRILDAAQIVEVVSEFVTLRKRGVNWVGLCPFHNEKTPSFSVSPSKGLCKCFSCGKGGNVVHFIMEHEQLSYYDALRWLAKKYGIEIKERELSDEERQAQSVRESLFVINDFAKGYFQNILYNHIDGKAIGMAYFRQRGFRDDTIQKFQLGFSTEKHDALAKEALAKGYNQELLIKTGLCYAREDGQLRDRFWGRVMFPVHTLSGKVVAFGGRVLKTDSKTAKYVNSPESEIYHKSNELYGIYFAKQSIVKQDKCFLVEGYTDVISMNQSGVENVVASSGTSLTSGQIRLIHRFTNNITVLYDGDMAGIKASIRGIDMLLEEGMNIKVVLLPDGEDPDSYARGHNATEFQAYIGGHEVDFIRFKTNLLLKDVGDDPIKKAGLIADIVKSIAVIPEAIVRSVYIKECSQMLHVEERILVAEIKKIKEKLEEKKGMRSSEVPAPTPTADGAEGQAATPAAETAADGTAPDEISATFMAALNEEKQTLTPKELLLVQVLVRFGEQVMCNLPQEDGTTVPVKVGEFVYQDMLQDGLTFSHPLFNRVLEELVQHLNEPGFVAEKHFIGHPDAAVSKLAVDLANDKYQLSKYHFKNQVVVDDSQRLHELVPHLLIDYKLAIVEMELEKALLQLKQPAILEDPAQSLEVMKHYKELLETKQTLARMLGDRVIDC